jgi:hypothetical protein
MTIYLMPRERKTKTSQRGSLDPSLEPLARAFKQTTSSPETPLPQENKVSAPCGMFCDLPGVRAMGMGKSETLTRLVA